MSPKPPAIDSPDTNTVRFSRTCRITGDHFLIEVPYKQYKKWAIDKQLIQDVFPGLSNEERELMVTGYTPEEWKELFSEF